MGTVWARRLLPRTRRGRRRPCGKRGGGNQGQEGPGAGRDGGGTEMGIWVGSDPGSGLEETGLGLDTGRDRGAGSQFMETAGRHAGQQGSEGPAWGSQE